MRMMFCLSPVLVVLATFFSGVARAEAAAVPRCTRSVQLSSFERTLLDEVNQARTQPAGYAALLRERYADLDARGRYRRDDGVRISTREGRRAVDEAVAYLARAKPVPPLKLASCLSLAARDHVADQGPKGSLDHVGSNGSQPSDRAGRYLNGKGLCGENISCGPRTPRDVVMQLIVDDGVPSRGHRNNLFKPDYKTLGVGTGPHARFGSMTVLLLCMHDVVE